jgi:2'-5' RNA ligase
MERPPSPLRLFVALPMPEAAKASLLEAQAALRRRAERSRLLPRWIGRDALHLTLKFLRYVAPERVAELELAIAREAGASPPITTCFSGLGAFASPANARVIVARLSDARAELLALFTRLEAAFETLGFALEARAFTPHVTLARMKTPGDVRSWLSVASLTDASFTLGAARLYRSTLKPTGAEYHVVSETALGG